MSKQENKEMLQKFRDSVDTKLTDSYGRQMEAVHSQISGFNMNWGINGCGFGQYYFKYDEDLERVVVDSEHMGPRFVELAIKQMLKTAVYGDFEEIQKIELEMTMDEAIVEISEVQKNEKFEVYYMDYDDSIGYDSIGYDSVKIKVEPQGEESERWKIIKFLFPQNIVEIAADDRKIPFVDGVKKYAIGVQAYYKTITLKDRD